MVGDATIDDQLKSSLSVLRDIGRAYHLFTEACSPSDGSETL